MDVFLIGVYFGGSIVMFFFWTSNVDLSGEEKAFYGKMLFFWPFYVVGLLFYRIVTYIRESVK